MFPILFEIAFIPLLQLATELWLQHPIATAQLRGSSPIDSSIYFKRTEQGNEPAVWYRACVSARWFMMMILPLPLSRRSSN